MDAQLADAQQLLQQLRHSQDPAVYVHPGLIVKRDEYGGLSLFVRQLNELDGLLADHMEAQGHDRWLGIAPEELLFAIPRSMMIEAPQHEPIEPEDILDRPEEHEANDNLLLSSGHGSNRACEATTDMLVTQHFALAKLIADLWLRQQQDAKATSQPCSQELASSQLCLSASTKLLHLYLACLPSIPMLSAVLPALWVIAGGIGTEAGSATQQQEAMSARLQLLQKLLSPAPAALHALHAQLDVMNMHALAAAGLQLPLPEQQQTQQQQQQTSNVQAQAIAECWGFGICWSRAIHLWSGPTLVPLADFINHSFPPNVMCTTRLLTQDEGLHTLQGCTDDLSVNQSEPSQPLEASDCSNAVTADSHPAASVPDPNRQQFICEAIKPLAPGTEIRWVYNAHDDDAGWLLCYGFVPDNGPRRPQAQPDDVYGQIEDSIGSIGRQDWQDQDDIIGGPHLPGQSLTVEEMDVRPGFSPDGNCDECEAQAPNRVINGRDQHINRLNELEAALGLCQELQAQMTVPQGLLAGVKCLLDRLMHAAYQPDLDAS